MAAVDDSNVGRIARGQSTLRLPRTSSIQLTCLIGHQSTVLERQLGKDLPRDLRGLLAGLLGNNLTRSAQARSATTYTGYAPTV